jgi:hypothetical protein
MEINIQALAVEIRNHFLGRLGAGVTAMMGTPDSNAVLEVII